MTGIEKKKSFIINTVYVTILIAIFYLFFKYALGPVFPILCAVIGAMILQKPLNYICSKTPVKRGIASTVLVLLSFLVLVFVVGLLILWIGSEFTGFVRFLVIQLEDIPALLENIKGYLSNLLALLPEKAEVIATNYINDKLDTFTTTPETLLPESSEFDFSILSTPLLGIWNTAKQIPTTLVSIVISVVSCCFMTSDFKSVKALILGFFPNETKSKLVRAKRLLIPSLGKMIKAYMIIITITFCELAFGLSILSFLDIYSGSYIFVIAALTAIIDIVPVLGTGTVLIPWAVFNLISGNYSLAVGLLVLYACITVIRQVIEPKLVAAQLGIPAFLTIVSMFLGSQIFGVIGIFILPITIVMLKLLNDEGIISIFQKAEVKEDEN